ncbi:MAG TPA: hypothetical protein DEA91_18620 [Paenibacillus sp.]|nr:hypothetical protein [Paenibacillus sp.]
MKNHISWIVLIPNFCYAQIYRYLIYFKKKEKRMPIFARHPFFAGGYINLILFKLIIRIAY